MPKFFRIHKDQYDTEGTKEIRVKTSDVTAISYMYDKKRDQYAICFMVKHMPNATFLYELYDTEDDCIQAYEEFCLFIENNSQND